MQDFLHPAHNHRPAARAFFFQVLIQIGLHAVEPGNGLRRGLQAAQTGKVPVAGPQQLGAIHAAALKIIPHRTCNFSQNSKNHRF